MMQKLLSQIKIILVEPAGALNVGSIARVMKNMGLQQLVLVNPQCDFQGEQARWMAVHGTDVLAAVQVVETLPEALQGCQRAIATTARSRSLPTNLETPATALPWLLDPEITNAALIFGPEDRGLSNTELNYAQRFVGIPANPEYPSLNLAQAVAVCAYELYQKAINLGATDITFAKKDEVLPTPAAIDAMEGYYQHLETLLLQIGYLYPHTAKARMEKFRRLFNRANLSAEEVGMLRGILSQVELAIKSKTPKRSQPQE